MSRVSPYQPVLYMARLPTAAAAANPLFPSFHNLDDMLAALKKSKMPVRGQITFWDESKRAIQFGHLNELTWTLKDIKEKSTIRLVDLYGLCYFVCRLPAAAKP